MKIETREVYTTKFNKIFFTEREALDSEEYDEIEVYILTNYADMRIRMQPVETILRVLLKEFTFTRRNKND